MIQEPQAQQDQPDLKAMQGQQGQQDQRDQQDLQDRHLQRGIQAQQDLKGRKVLKVPSD